MKTLLPILGLILLGLLSPVSAPHARAAIDDLNEGTHNKTLLILGSYPDFRTAHAQALAVSRASKTPISMRGMVYDRNRGLILSDHDEDTLYAGHYLLRRNNTTSLPGHREETEFISVELSDEYPGFPNGSYLVMGGIYDDARSAKQALARYQPLAPNAYVKKTKVFMGCLH